MVSRLMLGVLLGSACASIAFEANATCSGTPASNPDLTSFTNDPGNWLKGQDGKNLTNTIQSIGVAGSANPSPAFHSAVTTMLGGSKGDQSTALGTGLGTLAVSCAKEDVPFISAIQGDVSNSGNALAITAFGRKINPDQSASVGAAAGGGGTGSGGPTGGTNGGINIAGNGTPNQSTNLLTGGSVGAASAFSQR